MKKILRYFNLCYIIFFGLFVSCYNSSQSLYESYNKKFGVAEKIVSQEDLSPGDEGFDETLMLRQNYFVYSDATLSLAAPYNCDTYDWSIVDLSTGLELDVVTYGNSSRTSRTFVTYVPDSPWVIGTTYKLTLVVKKEDVEYTDSCEVVIYKHYDF